MKPAQWSGAQWTGALFALAAMVFVVTFAMNYLGDAGSPRRNTEGNTGTAGVGLTFSTRKFPEDRSLLEYEVKKPGAIDFWFVNANDRPLDVGLKETSCTKCVGADLFLLPPERRPELALLAARLTLAHRGALDVATREAVSVLTLRDLETSARQLPLEPRATVPAGALGWVRVHWTGGSLSTSRMTATLWMDNQEDGAEERLELNVWLREPIQVSRGREVSLGSVAAEELPRTEWIRCWSPTRLEFPLRTEVPGPSVRASDPFEVGRPLPLTPQELTDLEQTVKEGQILSGYRVSVTLRPLSPDGTTPCGLGPFRREVMLTGVEGMEPLKVAVTGVVEGAVRVDSGEGVVRFGPFNRHRGAQYPLTLGSDVPGLGLVLDRVRTAHFLKVHLPERPEVSASGHRSWRLRVEVLPKRVSGSFPRQDDPALRDCAVYLKTTEKPPRSIRIPVNGTANDG